MPSRLLSLSDFHEELSNGLSNDFSRRQSSLEIHVSFDEAKFSGAERELVGGEGKSPSDCNSLSGGASERANKTFRLSSK